MVIVAYLYVCFLYSCLILYCAYSLSSWHPSRSIVFTVTGKLYNSMSILISNGAVGTAIVCCLSVAVKVCVSACAPLHVAVVWDEVDCTSFRRTPLSSQSPGRLQNGPLMCHLYLLG